MPSAQELKRKKNKSARVAKSDIKIPKAKTGPIRRPDHVEVDEMMATSIEVEISEKNQSAEVNEHANPSDINIENESEAQKIDKKTKKMQMPKIFGLSFGAQILKSKFPKSFDIAEKVVDDWVSDGDFKDLPIETPLVQFYVGEGLRRVKDVEKKIETRLDDAGVLPIVRHQIGRAQKWINKK
jgi:hypothetical protein